MTRTDLLHEYLAAIGATPLKSDRDGYVDFSLHGCKGYVRVKGGGSRLRGSVVIAAVDDLEQGMGWVDTQPLPPTSELAVWGDTESGLLRLVWERSLEGLLAQDDPIAAEVEAIVKAWRDRAAATLPDSEFEAVDPRDSTPEQAWLLVGDEVVWPSDEGLVQSEESGHAGIFEYLWTSAKQTQEGDLVLIYIMGSRKAVHFVARAASNAFFTSDIEVGADGNVRNEQWWVYLTPPIEVEPIAFASLKEACNGQLILKGRSGKFLQPEAIDKLTFTAAHPNQQPEVERVVRKPVGRVDLPDPALMTWEDVRDLAGGGLRIESEVSRYVVEPLLRHCLKDTKSFYPELVMTCVPEYPIGRKRADYVVLKGDQPVCVVEVKLAINDSGDWARSPDLMQTVGYAQALECRAVLIDASRIVLIGVGSTTPSQIIQRRALDSYGLAEGNLHDLAEHLGVPYIYRANQGGEYRQPAADMAMLLGLGPRAPRAPARRRFPNRPNQTSEGTEDGRVEPDVGDPEGSIGWEAPKSLKERLAEARAQSEGSAVVDDQTEIDRNDES